ncbi:MAG: acetate kinase, partial [Clostridia bacterium]|nr:acetate kinase [Clostridia bacterium]
MKILVINSGSSSLKYQLIDMSNEEVVAKGLCERIAIDGHIKAETNTGAKVDLNIVLPNHTAAFNEVKKILTSGETKVIDSLNEIS